MSIIPFPGSSPEPLPIPPNENIRPLTIWIEGFENELRLRNKNEKTIDSYSRIFRQFMEWSLTMPGGEQGFHPQLLTRTAINEYFNFLKREGYSISHQIKVKSALKQVVEYLEEQNFSVPNPLKYIHIPVQPIKSGRKLSDRQRYILKTLVEQEGSARGAALFALGYHVGCRVSDVAHLRVKDVEISPQKAVLLVGYKNGKKRNIPINKEARNALFHYLLRDEPGCRKQARYAENSEYVFVSKRSDQLTEQGVNNWFENLKKQARVDWHEEIKGISWHDLRHDFAHRKREDEGWTLEQLGYYLGHVTKSGNVAIQSTARYTMPTEQGLMDKLNEFD